MHSIRTHFPFSLVSVCTSVVGVLLVVYIGLIAMVMSYAAITVEFSQSVKNDEATLAVLEAQYLAGVARIQSMDYHASGYAAPIKKHFVPASSVTALR